MSDTSKTAKIIKRWYYSTAHWQLDDVMVSDITFFMVFAVFNVSVIACCVIVAVKKCINWCSVHLFTCIHRLNSARAYRALPCSCFKLLDTHTCKHTLTYKHWLYIHRSSWQGSRKAIVWWIFAVGKSASYPKIVIPKCKIWCWKSPL